MGAWVGGQARRRAGRECEAEAQLVADGGGADARARREGALSSSLRARRAGGSCAYQGRLAELIEAGKRRAESLRRSQNERKRAREDDGKGAS